MSTSLSYLSNTTPEYLDNLYKLYRQNPDSVETEWRRFFEGFEFAQGSQNGSSSKGTPMGQKEINVLNLINGYRQRAHLFARTNPIGPRREHFPKLELSLYGLDDGDLQTVFQSGMDLGIGPAKLADIIKFLEEVYLGSLGIEYLYVREPKMVSWLRERMETPGYRASFSRSQKHRFFFKLAQANAFERFLGMRYTGQKRFSIEGAEGLIPALDAIIQRGAESGINEVCIGMAHRGRLNVLANILQKEYDEILSAFDGLEQNEKGFQGDVKYHLGYSSDVVTETGKQVHLSLLPNPSHLEAVDPVLQGITRAKIDIRANGDYSKILPILVHGDAAIAAQGVVYEVIQMSLLPGYKTGGTIHIIINNQVGFTTSDFDARSSTYCTDIAKVTQSPVFHVNGDDTEAIVNAVQMALDFRQQFNRDVFIDIVCYRLHGHNEADEPEFTQPTMYAIIKSHKSPKEVYAERLRQSNEISEAEITAIDEQIKAKLQEEFEQARSRKSLDLPPYLQGSWTGIRRIHKEDVENPSPVSGVELNKLKAFLNALHTLPTTFNPHLKIVRLFQERQKMVAEDRLDWALGELLAYASLLSENRSIRLSGQDVKRGTFSHRHASLFDYKSGEEYIPLNHIQEGNQGEFEAYNSLLSEFGVLGFEYGYSLVMPQNLVIWEAQFGDFVNGAQIIIDQFISSAETKWQRMSGLMMFLPHGYEGQGPEHSSARIERFLELCADNNMEVMNCTTPASFFHAIRRQFSREFRIPVVFFTPKKLLRYVHAVSKLEEFGPDKRFMELIDDPYANPSETRRILFCSGKVYYDLLERQKATERKDVAIVRLEQLYPLPTFRIKEVMERYSKAKSFYWVQEEPENMGPWNYILREMKGSNIQPIARMQSSSPATGYPKRHEKEQVELVDKAFS